MAKACCEARGGNLGIDSFAGALSELNEEGFCGAGWTVSERAGGKLSPIRCLWLVSLVRRRVLLER